MYEVRDADPSRDRESIRSLWHDYLSWGNEELQKRYGFQMPIERALERDLATISKFQPPDGRMVLAFAHREAVGIACLRRIGPTTAELKRMYVRPSHRGAGMGRAMLEKLIEGATAAGYRSIKLDSADFMTGAHSLYRSAGFVDTAPYPESEIPDQYRSRWVFMERALP